MPVHNDNFQVKLMPNRTRHKLRVLAALRGGTMREMVILAVDAYAAAQLPAETLEEIEKLQTLAPPEETKANV